MAVIVSARGKSLGTNVPSVGILNILHCHCDVQIIGVLLDQAFFGCTDNAAKVTRDCGCARQYIVDVRDLAVGCADVVQLGR